MVKLTFAERAWEEYLYWQETDKKNAQACEYASQRYCPEWQRRNRQARTTPPPRRLEQTH